MLAPTFMTVIRPKRAALVRLLPFVLYIVFLMVGTPLAHAFGVDPRWMYALQTLCVVVALVSFRAEYVELRRAGVPADAPLAGASGWLLALAVGFVVWAIWIWLDFPPFAFAPGKGYAPLDEAGALILPMVVVRIFGAAVVVPVMEELFWRSLVMRWLDDANFLSLAARSVTLRSLLFSSLAFGFEHGQWAAGIIAGLAYGGLYRASGRLWLAIAAHGLTNLLLGLWVVHTGQWHFW